MSVPEFIDLCDRQDFAVDVIDSRALALLFTSKFFIVKDPDAELVQRIFSSGSRKICFDMRRLLQLPGMPAKPERLYDVKLLYGGERGRHGLAKEFLPDDCTTALDVGVEKFEAHIRACETAQIDLNKYSLFDLIPMSFIRNRALVQCSVDRDLFMKKTMAELAAYDVRLPFYISLMAMERNGIKLDEDYVRERARTDKSQVGGHFFRSAAQLMYRGFVWTTYDPVSGRTGRIKVENGFNCHGIPHGDPRRAIVSRHEGGRIVSFDFNAIDYRSILNSVRDPEFKALFDGWDDFHLRTCAFLFSGPVSDLIRDVVKALTYVSIYGGSAETVSAKTGLSIGKAKDILERIGAKFEPIHDLRDRLHVGAIRDGFVTLPSGRRVIVEPNSHPGKVLGLYAQSFSSEVFEGAFMRAQELVERSQSQIIFTVHDELVLDLHPDDRDLIGAVTLTMEDDPRGKFKVNSKIGQNYRDLERMS